MKFEAPCACTTLRRAARAVTAAYDAALAPSGLRITQFSILRRLARLGPLPVTRLAAEAALDRSTMGRNLNPLERRGFEIIQATFPVSPQGRRADSRRNTFLPRTAPPFGNQPFAYVATRARGAPPLWRVPELPHWLYL